MSEIKDIQTMIVLMEQSIQLINNALKQHYIDIDQKCDKKLEDVDLINNPISAPASLCKKVKLTNSEVIHTIAKDTYRAVHKGATIEYMENVDLCEEYRLLCIDEETIKNGLRSSIDAVREILSRKSGRTNKSLNFLCNIRQALAKGDLTADVQDIVKFNKTFELLRESLINYYLATFDQVSAHFCKRTSLSSDLVNNPFYLVTPTMRKKDEFLSATANLDAYVSALDKEELPDLDVTDKVRYNKKGSPYGALYALLKGEKAECKVCDYLQRNLKYSYILHGVRTTRYVGDGKYSESDVVVINRHGIFSIEVKNIRSISEYYIYPNATEEAVKIINGKKEKYDGFKPLAQSSQHARSLRTFLIENNIIDELSTLTIIPMVAILNDSTNIIACNNANIKNIHHLTTDLIDYIENSSAKAVISDEDVYRIYLALKNKSIELGKYTYGSNIKNMVSSMIIDTERLYDALLPLSNNSLLLLQASIPIKAEKKKRRITIPDNKVESISELTFVPKTSQQIFLEGYNKYKNVLFEYIISALGVGVFLSIAYYYLSFITNDVFIDIVQVALLAFIIICVLLSRNSGKSTNKGRNRRR